MGQLFGSDLPVAKQWYQKARAQQRAKHYDKALVCFDRALALAPEEPNWWHWKGITLYELDRYEAALACFNRALEIAPANAGSAMYQAYTLFKLGRYQEALEAFDLALELKPDAEMIWYWKGQTFRKLGRDSEALSCFDRELEITPDSANARRERAAALFRLSRYEEALPAYDSALEVAAPNDPCALNYWKGRTLQYLRRDDEAVVAFDRALKVESNVADCLIYRAQSLCNLGRYADALIEVERAAELLNPDDVAWNTRGCAHYGMGHYEEALEGFDRASELAPTSVAIQRNKARALTMLKRHEEALEADERALQLEPDNAKTLADKGDVLFHLGRYAEATTAYEESIRLAPSDADLLKHSTAAMSHLRRTAKDQRLKLRDGRWLGFVELGDPDGIPVICCHGTPGSRLDMIDGEETVRKLNLRMIVPDRPGYGLSTFQRRRRLLDWPVDVEQLADYLGLRRFAVLGVSGGGPHALTCAYAIPHRLTHVGIVSSNTSPETMPSIRDLPTWNRPAIIIGRYLPWPLMVGILAPFSWFTRAFPRLAYALRTARPADEDADETDAPVVTIPKHISPVLREQLTEPFRHGARAHAQDLRVFQQNWGFRIADIRGEVYLWHGEQDHNVPAVMGYALAAAIPGCHATFYPGEGHDVIHNHLGEILSTLVSDDDGVAHADYRDSDSAEL